MKRRELWKMGEGGLRCCSSAIQTRLGSLSLLEQSVTPHCFIVFFVLSATSPNWRKRSRYIDIVIQPPHS